MEEWKTYKLGDIASVQTGPFGSQLHNEDYVNDGTPIVTVEHLGSREFTTQNLPMVSNEDKDRLIKYSLEEGDIVFSRVGSVDRCSYVGKEQKGWLFSGRCLRVRAEETINPQFLYYYFQKESVKKEIRNVAVGATMPSINTKLLSELYIVIPSKKEQDRIAEVLSSIDDKIELNNRINHNLEQQAQAFFSHWLNNCEDKVAISELCDNILDYTPITAKRVVALNSSDVTEGVFAELSYTPISEIKGQFKKRFEKGDILYSEIRPRNLHYAYCYFNPMDYIASTRLMVIRSKSEKLYSSVMLYQYLQMPKVFEEFTSKTESRSGTFPQGNFKDLSSSIVPYSGDNEEISIILESLYKLIWKNIDENKSLSSLRDSLLPILMSGELKINDLTC